MHLFDWFTVVAQIINFIVLVALLKHFLYKPVLEALDRRERNLAQLAQNAETTRLEAEARLLGLQAAEERLRMERQEILDRSAAEAEMEKRRLMESVHQEVQGMRHRQTEALRREQERLEEHIARSAQEEALSISLRVLRELADASLQDQVVRVFRKRLSEIGLVNRSMMISGHVDRGSSMVVRSAFELTEENRRGLSEQIREMMGPGVDLRFETVASMVCGIALVSSDYKLEWSIERYMAELRDEIAGLMTPPPA